MDYREWANGSHRMRCAKKNQHVIETMPIVYDIKCPGCTRKLRLWPNLGDPFKCDEGPDCLSTMVGPYAPGDIQNDGTNRFNCFRCDYDLCRSCVRNKMMGVSTNPFHHNYKGDIGAGGFYMNRAGGGGGISNSSSSVYDRNIQGDFV